MSSLLFGNGTSIVHWKPSSNTRGTFDILSTCIITMLLCVWTAVHLNVSPPGSVWGPRLRKVGWLVLALLAPEMVAYTAWYQRGETLSIMRMVNSAYHLSTPPSWHQKTVKGIEKAVIGLKGVFISRKQEPARQPTLEAQKSFSPENRHPWTLVHGFYALMGGIAFEIPENLPEPQRFLPSNTRETWFVGSKAIDFLSGAEICRDVLPNLSEEEIKSKSKANGLAKALVCTQALWFIAQCITRLAQRIPISLLELNTFGHAVCALLIYLLWWEKPFGVDYPTMIKGQILWDVRAYTWMRRNRSSVTESFNRHLRVCLEGDQWFQTLSESEKKCLLQHPRRDADLIAESDFYFHKRLFSDHYEIEDNGNYETNLEQETGHGGDKEDGSTILEPGHILQGTGFKVADLRECIRIGLSFLYQYQLESFDAYNGPHPPLPNVNLTTRDVTRWKMAWRVVQVYKSEERWPTYEELLVRRCKDWPNMDNISRTLPVALGFSAAALIYGGLHALAWFAHFDSSTEQLLWRISACVVMGGVPVMLVLFYLDEHLLVTEIQLYNNFPLILICLVLLAYVLARAYLVVECFINLSHLPTEVYDVPRWSAYFPHIS